MSDETTNETDELRATMADDELAALRRERDELRDRLLRASAEPANGRPDGEITAEVRRGYRLGQRLLRPAQVKVTRA